MRVVPEFIFVGGGVPDAPHEQISIYDTYGKIMRITAQKYKIF